MAELAAHLGRAWLRGYDLSASLEAVRAEDASLADAVEAVVVALSGPALGFDAYERLLRTRVLPDARLVAFFANGPLDVSFADHVRCHRVECAVKNVFALFCDMVHAGVPLQRLALVVMPTVTTVSAMTPFTADLCHFVHMVAEDVQTREYVLDHVLIENLARQTERGAALRLVSIAQATRLLEYPTLALPVVRRISMILVRTTLWRDAEMDAGVGPLVEFVTSAVASNASVVVPYAVDLVRRGPVRCFAQLYEALLGARSVEFVVLCHRRGVLPQLVATTTAPEFAAARAALARQWPATVADAGATPPAACGIECPITLAPCVHPVVASDGHTYERDAIITHLTTSTVSPMTKQTLSYDLVPNFAVMP